jgi:TPP-dependent pyruvate/acetoin dehydrogenase alpha subunit
MCRTFSELVGDGAANEGTFHEGLNFASILNLPVIFVCENNQFAEGTTHDYASASETSWNVPSFAAPSPKKHTATLSLP